MVVNTESTIEKNVLNPAILNVMNPEFIMKNLVLTGERSEPVIEVAVLYRVSTKKQLNPSENGGDIPTQQIACQNYINTKKNWVLVKEYTEKGVSGFKKKSSERDVLQQIMYDASNKKFSVFLVFMYDRIGRLADDTSIFIQALVSTGVEVWSVQEGQQKFDNHIDGLMNYIRSWQSNGESLKTSMRVTESHRQMVEEGLYRGGTVPFGYKTIPSGKFNKKGKELLKVVIDPEKAEIVSLIFNLVDQEGLGQYRIPQILNEKGIKTNTGKPWASNSVSFLLHNPMYKGYMVYGKGTDNEIMSKNQLPDLVIVDEAKWQRVQDLRKSRNPENTKIQGVQSVIRNSKSSLILVGMIRCGHCGNPLTTTWNVKKYLRKGGIEVVKRTAKYRCSGTALQKVVCDGKTIHAQNRLEGIVLAEVYKYLDQLEAVDLSNEIKELTKKNSGAEERELRKLKKQLEDEQTKLSKYKAEVIKVISRESKFNEEMLSELVEETKHKIVSVQSLVTSAEKKLDSKKVEVAEMEVLQHYVPVWREVFDQASPEKKKMMLSSIINNIQVHRDRIEIDFKLHIGRFIGIMGMNIVTNKYIQVDTGRVLTHNTQATNAG